MHLVALIAAAFGGPLFEPSPGPFVATQVTVSPSGSCARGEDGHAYCWGDLGGAPESRPRRIAGADELAEVRLSGSSVAVRLSDGTVRSGRDALVAVPGVIGATAITSWNHGFCALQTDGQVVCWTRPDDVAPIAGLTQATQLSCDDATCCAARADRSLACWGTRDVPKLGLQASNQAVPWAEQRADAVFLGRDRACLRTGKLMTCLGEPVVHSGAIRVDFGRDGAAAIDAKGQLIGRRGQLTWSLADAVDVDEHDDHGCAVTADGSVFCWGDNGRGQLGDGSPIRDPKPEPVLGLNTSTRLQVSATEGCAVQGRKLWCWGSQMSMPRVVAEEPDVLGNGQYAAGCHADGESVRCSVSDLKGSFRRHAMGELNDPIVALAADRGTNLCAANDEGEVYCRFSLGEGGLEAGFRRIGGLRDVVELAPAALQICGRTDGGAVGCWADDRFDGDPDAVESPGAVRMAAVQGLNRAVQLAAGQELICARNLESEVWCRGSMGEWFAAEESAAIESFTGATDLDGNHLHLCAVVAGEVRCFGDNAFGQLGTAPSSGSEEPVTVPLPLPAVDVGVGRDHTCARLEDGSVWCWGSDRRGQLGRGRLLQSDEPTPVFGTGRLLLPED